MNNPLSPTRRFNPLWRVWLPRDLYKSLKEHDANLAEKLPNGNSFAWLIPPYNSEIEFLSIELPVNKPLSRNPLAYTGNIDILAYIEIHVRNEILIEQGMNLEGAKTVFVSYDKGLLRVTWPGEVRTREVIDFHFGGE